MSELDRSLTNIDWLISCSRDKQPIKTKSEKTHFCGNCIHCSRLGSRPKPPKSAPDQSAVSDTSSAIPAPNKPKHSYASIIATAIRKSTNQKMTLNEIYTSILDTYPYFRNVTSGWKNSVRHNLSLNKLFKRVPRPKAEPGKGAYWEVDHKALLALKSEPKSPHRKCHNLSKAETTPSLPLSYPPIHYPLCPSFTPLYPLDTPSNFNQSFTAFYRSLLEVQRLDDVSDDPSQLRQDEADVSRFEGLVNSINPGDKASGNLFMSMKDSFSNFLRQLSNGPEPEPEPEVEIFPKEFPPQDLYSSNEPSSQEFDWNAIL